VNCADHGGVFLFVVGWVLELLNYVLVDVFTFVNGYG